MPIQHAIWKVGDIPTQLPTCKLPSEQKLEEMIVKDPGILSSEWMLIGRQESTAHGGRIDLLANSIKGLLSDRRRLHVRPHVSRRALAIPARRSRLDHRDGRSHK